MNLLYAFYERRALNAFVENDFPKARDLFNKMLKKWPQRIGIRHNLGLVYVALRDFQAAETCFLKDLEDYGESVSRHRALGDLYFSWGKASESAQHYEKALALARAENRGSRSEISPDINFMQRRIALCNNEEAFRKAMEGEAALQRGLAAQQHKDWELAYREFKTAAEADPTNFPAWNNRGSIAMNMYKDIDEAKRCFAEAAKLSAAPAIMQNLLLVTKGR
ncbi:tetratricopeptide repeat protein [Gracilinema caldarium]|uniref:Tetratricopeptide TPR_1 repeat-containing protein n=1 Tax=Gracilinema caldarium (strain ATCC 51460 / DSM 7334 / H1) TaxID=744872 RepID=F8F4F5_GRAC1|nr:tetratricopeptide repeat protein [Gracilinema caldarium]AEJ20602.1 Tetratricopeptide TPR_1 repeat-containing protein [Gracilinema caldarium DSM 7334]